MNVYKSFLLLTASGLVGAGLGFSPDRVRAEAPPTMPPLVLDQGPIGTRLDFDFVSGGKYFDGSEKVRESYPGFNFTDGKTTFGLSYGLTGDLTLGLSLPVIRRVYSGYYQAMEEYLFECPGGGTSTTFTNYLNIPYDLKKTGIGDVTLETAYRFSQLPRFLPELAARIAWKAATGSSGIDLDREEINLGDGQSDLFLGINGKGKTDFLLYDFSFTYRIRFAGNYGVTQAYYDYETMEKKRYTETYHYQPGDEFSAGFGISAYYRQLTLGVSGNYINIGKSRTWLEEIAEVGQGAGYYFNFTPAVSLKPSPGSAFSFSVEVPVAGKNYPVNSPSPLLYGLFDYRWSLDFQYRI